MVSIQFIFNGITLIIKLINIMTFIEYLFIKLTLFPSKMKCCDQISIKNFYVLFVVVNSTYFYIF